MTFLTSPVVLQRFIQIIYAILIIAGIVNVFLSVMRKVKPIYVVLACITLALAFFSALFLNWEMYETSGGFPYSLAARIVRLPLWILLTYTVLLATICVTGLVMLHFYGKTRLSAMSLKESLDSLSTGVCFAETSGLPRLVNVRMNELCMAATGKSLLNADSFWTALTDGNVAAGGTAVQTGDNPMVKFEDGRVFSFSRYERRIAEKTLYEIIAVDITKEYALSLDLQEKNAELSEFNRRMRLYGEKIDEYTAEKEALEAKIHIHDELGKLLLTTSKRLQEKPSAQEKRNLLKMWRGDLEAFGVFGKDRKHDSYRELMQAAKTIGVKIVFDGIRPTGKRAKKIVVTAAVECMTNTASHAKGDEMYVTINECGASLELIIKNNGLPPAEEMKEGGGLSSLRALVEREGGTMIVKSRPEFELKIILPQGGI